MAVSKRGLDEFSAQCPGISCLDFDVYNLTCKVRGSIEVDEFVGARSAGHAVGVLHRFPFDENIHRSTQVRQIGSVTAFADDSVEQSEAFELFFFGNLIAPVG